MAKKYPFGLIVGTGEFVITTEFSGLVYGTVTNLDKVITSVMLLSSLPVLIYGMMISESAGFGNEILFIFRKHKSVHSREIM